MTMKSLYPRKGVALAFAPVCPLLLTVLLLGGAPSDKRTRPLTELSPLEARRWARDVANERREVIAATLDALRDTKLRQARSDLPQVCAYVLGELRAAEGVEDLISGIDSIQPEVSHGNDLDDYDPCVRALTRIGKPASDACLRALASEQSPGRRQLLVRVLAQVETPEFARFRLRNLIEKEGDATKKSNLDAALHLILDRVTESRRQAPASQPGSGPPNPPPASQPNSPPASQPAATQPGSPPASAATGPQP